MVEAGCSARESESNEEAKQREDRRVDRAACRFAGTGGVTAAKEATSFECGVEQGKDQGAQSHRMKQYRLHCRYAPGAHSKAVFRKRLAVLAAQSPI